MITKALLKVRYDSVILFGIGRELPLIKGLRIGCRYDPRRIIVTDIDVIIQRGSQSDEFIV
jgi:hypothetical protein